MKNNKPYEGVRCISCKYAVRNKEGELNPRDIVCSMWCSDGFEAGDYCSRGEEGVYVSDNNCIQDQEGEEIELAGDNLKYKDPCKSCYNGKCEQCDYGYCSEEEKKRRWLESHKKEEERVDNLCKELLDHGILAPKEK